MDEFKNKTNNDILLEIKQMQFDYEAVKANLLRDYDLLEMIEARFNEANDVLNTRLSGGKK
jgi:hypothetical protein